ncbi:MAG: hypothetical protein MRY74_01345 [Neomegalonema sp.]|nr:hypothetical protein [Neomegalonema sp.]
MAQTYTPFGKALKTLQIDYGFRTADVANAWGASTSFVYAVMSGRKPAPPQFIETISEELGITEDDREYLKIALDQTPGAVNIVTKSPLQAEVANAFARQINGLPDEELQRLRTLLGRPAASESAPRARRSISAA